MKKILLIALMLIPASAWAAQRTATTSGDWSAKETWGGALPGDGDTIIVNDGVTVTVSDERIIGTSGASGTLAVNLNNSGALVVAKGGTLRVRGDLAYTAGIPNTSVAATVKGGGAWLWDASKAASPMETHYKFYPSANMGLRGFILAGTDAAHAVLASDPAGGAGCFTIDGKYYGGGFQSMYADITRIGDAKTPGWDVYWCGPLAWDVQRTTFTQCGSIKISGGVNADTTFRHNYNFHVDTQGPQVFSGNIQAPGVAGKAVVPDIKPVDKATIDRLIAQLDGQDPKAGEAAQKLVLIGQPARPALMAALTSASKGATQRVKDVLQQMDYAAGRREILANVFDADVADWPMPGGFTIRGNYLGGGINVHIVSSPWAAFDTNLIRIGPQRQDCIVNVAGKRFADSYVFIDKDFNNPHVLWMSSKFPVDVDGVVMYQAGACEVDSGEFVMGEATFATRRCIMQPNMYGYSSGEAWAVTSAWPDARLTCEHNTWFGGWCPAQPGHPGFAAVQYSEGGNGKPGQIVSLRSNIFWNPQIRGTEASFVKMSDIGSLWKDQGAGLVEDFGDPKNLDYNDGWGFTKDLNFPNAAHYTNQGRGYNGKWSVTPGQHDVEADPQFVDWQRDIVLFATKGLKATPSRGQWSAKPDKAYAVGDTVINTTLIEWGLPVMYRYIGKGENPEPGAGSRAKGDLNNWRKSWEWASLYYIREGVRTRQAFGDDDMIMHLIKWVREGYAPTNPALKGTAHDGTDIGAVPFVAKPASPGPTTAPAGTPAR